MFQALVPSVKGPHICFGRDNCTAMSHINKLGGTQSQTLSNLAIMELCPEQKPDNFSNSPSREAECLGKSKVKYSQAFHRMVLNPSIFRGVVASLGRPDMDLFVSRVYHQIPEFVSWQSEPNAMANDVFNLA